MTGLVCDIQRFSVQDGPGIRTTVFLQGCTLSCAWCHNPETIPARPVTMRLKPRGGQPDEKPSSVPMDAAEVMATVLEDRPFYARGGGGLTVSGGEPLVQANFTLALLRQAADAGIHTALDTAGHVPWDSMERVLPFAGLFLYDYKVTGDAKAWIGAGTAQSLSNLRRLHDSGANIILRCPIIPGVNDNAEHLRGIASVLGDCPGIRSVELLAYHRLGEGKYHSIGREYTLGGVQPWDEARRAAFLESARAHITHPLKWG